MITLDERKKLNKKQNKNVIKINGKQIKTFN